MQNEPGERDAIGNTSPLPGRAQIKGIVMVREDGGALFIGCVLVWMHYTWKIKAQLPEVLWFYLFIFLPHGKVLS